MHDTINILNRNGYQVQNLLNSGAYGNCFFVRKNNLKSCIIKVYKDNEKSECVHETEVYNDLHGQGLGKDWLFKCEKIEIEERCFLELETYEGCTLEDYLFDSKRQLSIADKLSVLIEACDTISNMHKSKCSYLHLDIKLSNFYISDGKLQVKPIDMGSAVSLCHEKNFDVYMNDLGYMSTEGYASKKIRKFNELRKKYRTRRVCRSGKDTYLLNDTQKDLLVSLGNRINVKDDIFSLICCVLYVFTGGKKVGFWSESDSFEYNPKKAIQQCLEENNIPSYILDEFVELFVMLIEPNRDENKEVAIETVDELIDRLEKIVKVDKEEGITDGIILKNAIKIYEAHFSKVEIDPDLLTGIVPIES